MTVAPSQFTLPLATLNPKVRASGGLAVCLTTNSCPLQGFSKAFCMPPSAIHYPHPTHLPPMACPAWLLSKVIILLIPAPAIG